MPSLPLVSIVTPSFNQAQFLEETILSVLHQDYPNIEYIIIDGGSTDGSVDIIHKYADRLAYWVSEPDRGQTHAIIKGFERANGSLMGWLCSDDLLESSMVNISVDYHLWHPKVGLTYGDRVRIDGKGNIYSLQRFPSFRSWFIPWGFSIPQETTLFKRDVYDRVGGLDETLQMVMDFDLWCRISSVAEIRHIPAFLGRFRAHRTTKSSEFSRQIQRSGFEMGWPAEYAQVYASHFGRNPSTTLIKLEKIIESVLAMLERRTERYYEELETIEAVRLA